MAGHSQFANIKHRKNAQDSKRAKLFTKLLREITVAAKTGQADPDFNPRLRTAIIEAKSNNLPKDRIDAAIKKVVSGSDSSNYENIRYEGYSNSSIAVIVEALTDNKNRTAGEVRSLFSKSGGSLGETGSLNFLFDHCGLIKYSSDIDSFDDLLEFALELNVIDIVEKNSNYYIYTAINDFISVRDDLINKFSNPIISRIIWKAKDLIDLEDENKIKNLINLIESLEDLDDVTYVYTNYNDIQI